MDFTELQKALVEETQKGMETIKSEMDDLMADRMKTLVGKERANITKEIVQTLRAERAVLGYDKTGLSKEQKKAFAETVKAVAFGAIVKANEELISESDARGGYLIPVEVASAILRIAASVGIVMSQARSWTMNTDELDIPSYTGSFLEGEYLGVNAAGSLTGVTFTMARLLSKKWQLAFAVGNDLLQDANQDIADWLLALAGEALANQIDKQAFAGTGAPFIGLLNDANVTVQTLATGKDTFAEYDVVEDSSDAIANIEESMLDGAAFYFSRTVWAKLRVQKDDAGSYVLPNVGAPSSGLLAMYPVGGGPKPAGEILGFPVFTCRHLPVNSATAVSTKFGVFGNMKAFAFGNRGQMSVEKFTSGTFGSKEIALADQVGMVIKHRHGMVNALPAAFDVIKTAAA